MFDQHLVLFQAQEDFDLHSKMLTDFAVKQEKLRYRFSHEKSIIMILLIGVSIFLFVRQSVYLSLSSSTPTSIHPSIRLSVRPSVVRPSVHLSAIHCQTDRHLSSSIHPFAHPSICF
jgi:hypothetical protein